MNEQLFLTTAQFLDKFKERDDEIRRGSDTVRPFCWVIGSGASAQSKIEMGRTLAAKWLKKLFHDECKVSDPEAMQQWLKTKFHYIDDIEYESAADFFPYIFHERFKGDPQEGQREIDRILDSARMSPGYSVLAHLMTDGHHRVAVSTYIDNLVFEGIVRFTGIMPLVCGHETVMNYIDPSHCKKPLIAKPQRDIMVFPRMPVEHIQMLSEDWKTPLINIFDHYTPIVIGYGDLGYSGGALMTFLKELYENDGNRLPGRAGAKGRIYWCYREESSSTFSKPKQEVQDLVESLDGHLVPIAGFDELMLQLWTKLKLSSMSNKMKGHSMDRIDTYRMEFEQLIRRSETLSGNSTTVATLRASAKEGLQLWLRDNYELS
jgi:hypothetical protein